MGLNNFIQLNRMDVDRSNLADESNNFNTIIGYIEDIVISDSFQVRHKVFYI